MGMIEARSQSFTEEVLEASRTVPVLVDFWAPWCGPCRMLGPVLEKLEREYAGKWKLVKVNSDEEQALAGRYRVSGIPHCVLFKDGEPADTFTGALPEPHLRKFLDKHIPNEEHTALLTLARTDPMAAVAKILEEKTTGSDADAILWGAIPGILGQPEMLAQVLPRLPDHGAPFSDAVVALKEYMHRHRQEGAEGLAEAMSALEGLFDEKQAGSVLEALLRRFEEDPAHRELFKADLVGCFRILGQNHPLVNDVRKRLARLLA